MLSFQTRITHPSLELKGRFPALAGQDHSYSEPLLHYSTSAVRVDDRPAHGKSEATYYLHFQGRGALPTFMQCERTDFASLAFFVQATRDQLVTRGSTYQGDLPGFTKKRRAMLEVWSGMEPEHTGEGWLYRITVQITVQRTRWLCKVQTLTMQQFVALAEHVRDAVLKTHGVTPA